MKNIISGLFMQITLFLLFTGVYGQTTIRYTYDNAGNRTDREVIVFRIANPSLNDSALSATQANDSISAFSENIGNFSVSVFPNPTLGRLTLKIINNHAPEQVQLSEIFIYNEAGTLLEQIKTKDMEQNLDFSTYTVGIYYLKVMINGKNKTFKIVKTN